MLASLLPRGETESYFRLVKLRSSMFLPPPTPHKLCGGIGKRMLERTMQFGLSVRFNLEYTAYI